MFKKENVSWLKRLVVVLSTCLAVLPLSSSFEQAAVVLSRCTDKGAAQRLHLFNILKNSDCMVIVHSTSYRVSAGLDTTLESDSCTFLLGLKTLRNRNLETRSKIP
jgi:hypothetical protein